MGQKWVKIEDIPKLKRSTIKRTSVIAFLENLLNPDVSKCE